MNHECKLSNFHIFYWEENKKNRIAKVKESDFLLCFVCNQPDISLTEELAYLNAKNMFSSSQKKDLPN